MNHPAPMDTNSNPKSTLKVPAGSKATPPPDVKDVDKANGAIFMTIKHMSEKHTAETFKDKLTQYLNEEHKNLIE